MDVGGICLMASLYGERTTNSENIFREIQTEHMIYQINSSSDTKKTADKMKKNIDEITKIMEDARRITYEKKIATDELKINLSEKKDKLKKLQQEYERTQKHVELSSIKALDVHTEANKIINVMEKINEAAYGLDPKYLEQSQNDLADSLVKITLEVEKAQSDLDVARKMDAIVSKKLQDAEIDFNKLDTYTFDKISETERIISNVSITIEHIIKSYDEVTVVSKDLLKSALLIKTEFEEESRNESEQNQPHRELSDVNLAI
jgi:hypothetical protein